MELPFEYHLKSKLQKVWCSNVSGIQMVLSRRDSTDDKAVALYPAYPGSKPIVSEFSNFRILIHFFSCCSLPYAIVVY